MKLLFHGAAREVGRSCIELRTRGERYLMDCGVKFVTRGFKQPEGVFRVKKLNGVFISHAHLDHTGALPFFEHYGLRPPIFLTSQTLAITRILLRDSYKVAHVRHLHPAWNRTDLREVRRDARLVEMDRWYRHGSLKFLFLNAGHIPGSAMILIEAEGKRFLYTGDVNTRTTNLMEPARFALAAREHGPIHALITESTYGHRLLPPRAELEREFLATIKRVLRRGGSVLVPVFALGRAQEVLLMLAKERWPCPVYFDGMCQKVTRAIINRHPPFVNTSGLRAAFQRVTLVRGHGQRRLAREEHPAIYVTTSGMMQGGPAIDYLKALWHDERHAVLLMGFQVHGTNGYRLLEEGWLTINGWKTIVKCEVRKFDFSGHADSDDLKRALWDLNPRHVIFQHGDEESVLNLEAWARAETPFTVHAPVLGDEITL